MGLHPVENRGYRELFAFGRGLIEHWTRLSEALAGSPWAEPFADGAGKTSEMLAELRPLLAEHDLHGGPAALGLGATIGRQRASVRDRFLERDRALRMGALDAQYLTTLLGYLRTVAEGRGDEQLAGFCGRHERRMKRVENAARKAAISAGADPDAAVEPLDSSVLGRAGQSISYAVGALGEWVDRRAASTKND